jgi:UDP-N-acetyl-D-glucosamine dehydrogenase
MRSFIGRYKLQITVVGLGKIGLPLAVQFASKGHEVFGVDINPETVGIVNQGLEPFPGEKDLAQKLHQAVTNGKLKATSDFSFAVGLSGAIVVAVPLFITEKKKPDFSAIDMATQEIGMAVSKGALVCYETTLPVGTSRNRLTPILERESGLVEGDDFYVAFSPERVLTGRVFGDLRRYPKLVGGVSKESDDEAVAFYESVLDFDDREDLPRKNGVWSLGSSEAAEMAKLAETTYRDVNIGLANQFAIHAEDIGVDIHQVIEACNSQHFSHIHQPGASVGGHCIPVYPHLYLEGDTKASVVSAARAANKAMPSHLVNRLEVEFGALRGKTILILGLAYRPGVKEAAFSGAWDLVSLIHEKGGVPVIHDPLYSDAELISYGLTPHQLGERSDAAILHTNHDFYSSLEASDLPGVRVIADGRNAISKNLKSQIKTYVLGKG